MMTCSVDDCTRPKKSHGLCNTHNERRRRNGHLNLLVEQHGAVNTPEWNSWFGMRQRCNSTTCKDYPRYGGRGIKVCDRWDKSFSAFLEDMGKRPHPKHSLDRIDVNGNYEPGNCRWADIKTQNRNHRRNRRITFNGETLTMIEWSERAGVNYQTFRTRVNEWKDFGRVLTEPLHTETRTKAAREAE